MSTDDSVNLTGQFLIALPSMGDPRFQQAVIYVCSHDPSGAMGIVINHPKTLEDGTPLSVYHVLSQSDIDTPDALKSEPVRAGGPVDIDRGFVLHTADYFQDVSTLKLTDTLSLTTTRDVLEALGSDTPPAMFMLSIGYAGWGPGQIEQELMQNSWITAPADEALIFDKDDDAKWAKALAGLGITPDMLAHTGGRA